MKTNRVTGIVLLSVVGLSMQPGMALAYTRKHSAPTDLMNASDRGDLGTIRRLIKAGTQINAFDARGMSALKYAVQGHQRTDELMYRTVNLLLDAGADVNLADKDSGQTPLMEAAFFHEWKLCSLLVHRGADVNKRDNSGQTAIFFGSNDVQTARTLIKLGANVRMTDDMGETALHQAVFRHNTEVVTALVGAGADPSIEAKTHETPLAIAERDHLKEILRILRRAVKSPKQD